MAKCFWNCSKSRCPARSSILMWIHDGFIIPWIATPEDKKVLIRFFPGLPFELVHIILAYCEHFPDIEQLMSVLEVFDTEASLLFHYQHINIDPTALGYWLEHNTFINELDISNIRSSMTMSDSIFGDLEARGIGKALEKNTTLTILDTRGNPAMSGVGTMTMATAIIRSLTMKSFNGICTRKFQENSVGTELILRNKRVGDSGVFLLALHIAPHMLSIGDRVFVSHKPKEEINVGDVIYPKIHSKPHKKNKKNIISGTVEGINKKSIALVRFGSKNSGNLCHYSMGEIALKRYPGRIMSINNNNTFDISFECGLIRRSCPFENMINRDLTNLDLYGNDISNYGIHALSLSLEHNSTLLMFTLEMNLISDKGACDLSEILKSNTTLTKLNLCSNQISCLGAGALAKSIHTNTTLRWLHLGHNTISDDGAVSLSRALKINQSLKSLYLTKNNITNHGMIALADSLKNNATLIYLDLSKNIISDNGVISLGKALKSNKALTGLNLSGNKVTDDGMCALGEALKINKCLKTLDMSKNKIDGACVIVLEDALDINKTLIDLQLSGNKISSNINSNAGSGSESNTGSSMNSNVGSGSESNTGSSIERGCPYSIESSTESGAESSIESSSIESMRNSIERQSIDNIRNSIESDSESTIGNKNGSKITRNPHNTVNSTYSNGSSPRSMGNTMISNRRYSESIESSSIESSSIQISSIESPSIENPIIESPNIESTSIGSPSIESPSIENPSIENPSIENKSNEIITKSIIKSIRSDSENSIANNSRNKIPCNKIGSHNIRRNGKNMVRDCGPMGQLGEYEP